MATMIKFWRGAGEAREPVSVGLILAAARVDYRIYAVVEAAGYPDGWRDPAWMGRAACLDQAVTVEVCQGCPAWQECLAAALITADPAPVRGGLTRVERADLWDDIDAYARSWDPEVCRAILPADRDGS